VHGRNAICFVGSWSWVPALQFCWVLFLQTHPFFKGFKGWMLDLFFLVALLLFKAAISWQHLFKVKSEAM
jgi:hypothetical protein